MEQLKILNYLLSCHECFTVERSPFFSAANLVYLLLSLYSCHCADIFISLYHHFVFDLPFPQKPYHGHDFVIFRVHLSSFILTTWPVHPFYIFHSRFSSIFHIGYSVSQGCSKNSSFYPPLGYHKFVPQLYIQVLDFTTVDNCGCYY